MLRIFVRSLSSTDRRGKGQVDVDARGAVRAKLWSGERGGLCGSRLGCTWRLHAGRRSCHVHTCGLRQVKLRFMSRKERVSGWRRRLQGCRGGGLRPCRIRRCWCGGLQLRFLWLRG